MDRYTGWTFFREAGFWIAALPVLMPLYLVLTTAIRPAAEVGGSAFRLPADPTFANFARAWQEAGGEGLSFGQALFNSVVTTAAVIVVLVALAAPAGYVLARRSSRLSATVSGAFVLSLVLPVQLGLIPLYSLMVATGLAGTRTGLVLVYAGMQLPLAVFLYTGFFRGLPTAYEEAARVDGATTLRIFIEIAFPLVRPITGVVVVLSGLFVWNDFFVALVFVGDTDKATLPVAVYSFVGRFSAQWPLIFASAIIALVPVLVLYGFAQRSIMNGFVSTLR